MGMKYDLGAGRTSFKQYGMARMETPMIELPRLMVGRKVPFMVPPAGLMVDVDTGRERIPINLLILCIINRQQSHFMQLHLPLYVAIVIVYIVVVTTARE